jgi:hypothetical protein
MAQTPKSFSAAGPPPAPERALRIEALRATAERKPRNLERRTAGVSVAHIEHVEKIAIRRVRRTVADVLAKREVDPRAGFVQLQIPRLGDAMVVAHTEMTEGDLQATEYRRRALSSLFAARSQTGQKTAPKSLIFPMAGHGSACRDVSPRCCGTSLDPQFHPTGCVSGGRTTARRRVDGAAENRHANV